MEKQIVSLAIQSRIIILSIGLLSSLIVGPYDTSSYIINHSPTSEVERIILTSFRGNFFCLDFLIV